MPDNKRISELATTPTLDGTDLFEIAQVNAGSSSGYASLKTTLTAIANKIAKGIQFGDLQTSAKDLIDAINEAAISGGNSNIADDYDNTQTYVVGDYRIYEGVLYRCNTDIPVAESFDSTKWDAVLVTDELGQSGGGGHEILDDSGTGLTQRDELQFVGTYSEDDSTNEITKVNIVREMTKAQYDLLSAAQKKGIIRTTDEPDGGGGGSSGGGINYSLTEQNTGLKWIDGSDIYQKTVTFSQIGGNGGNWISTDADISSLNVDLKIGARLMSTDDIMYEGIFTVDNGNLRIMHFRGTSIDFVNATIQYTKSTS